MKIDEIIITNDLASRTGDRQAYSVEKLALNVIARKMSLGRGAVLQALCQLAMDLCSADSAGISVLMQSGDTFSFTWDALVGRLKGRLGATVPYDSPCGVCIEFGSPQLFAYPERYFNWMQVVDLPVAEALIIPLRFAQEPPQGTLWIMAHDKGPLFNSEHERIMIAISGHAATALKMLTI